MEECRLLRLHECQQCGKRFKARGGLQQHMRIHSNERPYHCHFCPKRFTQKSHVDQHERIHTGAKPFSCQFCGRAFRQRSQQIGHEATHASGPLSVVAGIANQQHQLRLSAETSLHVASDQQSPANTDGSSNGHPSQAQQVGGNVANVASLSGNDSGLLLSSSSGRIGTHSAVTSLLALSQGAPMNMPSQTIMHALGRDTNAGGGGAGEV
ncbi:hypothetical protein AB6A40_001688 [Gnathostoma spinigerum]|uniref:C2H2-type domain-containing protein n=1 Tax=Gnathostoma spinigerum TaxID=75299 RepID=A0ABD6EA07_9BILA